MDTIKRTSRETELRKEQEAPKVWTPPSSLDAPPAPKGYVHRWIRVTIQGFEDTSNVSRETKGRLGICKSWIHVQDELGSNEYPVTTLKANIRG
jgi:hypothetical protein